MESFILNAFSEHLSAVIVGFSRDQINSNLLTGRGEITDVNLNCAFLNDILRSYTQLAVFESVLVTRLGINVTSFSNIKKAPIEIIIDEVHVRLVEPLHFQPAKESNSTSTSGGGDGDGDGDGGNGAGTGTAGGEKENSPKARSAGYGLVHRIGDNIHVEINRIHIVFQPLGRFKTRRVGPWTPPALTMTLRNFRYVSVDEHGEEGTPDQVWRHNDKDRRKARLSRTGGHHSIFIYKKLSLGCSLGVQPSAAPSSGVGGTGGSPRPPPTCWLFRSVPVECQITMHKRRSDAAFLSAQNDVRIDDIEVGLDGRAVPLLVELAVAVGYLIAKDRTYVDPLSTSGGEGGVPTGSGAHKEASAIVSAEKVHGGPGGGEKGNNDQGMGERGLAEEVNDGDSSSEDEHEEEFQGGNEGGTGETFDKLKNVSEASSDQAKFGTKFYPAYQFKSGFAILDRISLSLTVNRCRIRMWYPSETSLGDEYLECVMKGLINEAIWPKVPGERGGYVQMSLSHLFLQERYGSTLRPLVVAGQLDDTALITNRRAPDFSAAENSFPFFEDRSIRVDGPFLNPRSMSIYRAIAVKITIDIGDNTSTGGQTTNISAKNDFGMDRIDMNLDMDACSRVIRFCLNKDGGGFNPRWFTGDWSDVLLPEMFVASVSSIPSLGPYLQDLPLRSSTFISPEQFELTSKMTNIRISLPSPIHQDVQCSDAIIALTNMTVLVSSALPKTFLDGDIAPPENGGTPIESIAFPNHPSDISYNSFASEPGPSYRVQISQGDLSVRVVPSIPFRDAEECLWLLAPTNLNCLVSIDFQESGSILYLSVRMQRFECNIDLDVLTSLASTAIYHAGIITASVLPFLQSFVETYRDETPPIPYPFRAGDLSALFCLHIPAVDVRFWSQDCCLKLNRRISGFDTPTRLSALLLARLRASGLEIGVELSQNDHTGAIGLLERLQRILKVAFTSCHVDLCDLGAMCDSEYTSMMDEIVNTDEDLSIPYEVKLGIHDARMTNLLKIGNLNEVKSGKENDTTVFRLDCDEALKVVSCGLHVTSAGEMTIWPLLFEPIIEQVIEALFRPTGTIISELSNPASLHFPKGSIGCALESFLMRFGKVESEATDTAARGILSQFRQFEVRIRLNHFSFTIPHEGLPTECEMRNSTILLGHFDDAKQEDNSPWLRRFSGSSSKWNVSFKDEAPGPHLLVSSSQSLCTGIAPNQNIIIPSFDIEANYHPASAEFRVGSVKLAFREKELLEQFIHSITGVVNDCHVISGKIMSTFSGMDPLLSSDVEQKSTKNTVHIAYVQALRAIRNASNSLSELSDLFFIREEECKRQYHCQQENVKMLRKLTFLKETQRRAALSLVSSRVCGWIRMGGTSGPNGQRVLNTTSLWKYWALLRKRLLLITERPGSSNIIEIVPLKGALLRKIEGGNRYGHLQRGFAIVEASGHDRFFVCSTADDYEMWLNELIHVTGTKIDSSQTNLHEEKDVLARIPEAATPMHSKSRGPSASANSLAQIRPRLQNKLPSLDSSVMRDKLSSANDRFQNKMSSLDSSAMRDKLSLDSSAMRNKLASAKDRTKVKLGDTSSKLGSAMMSAKNKGESTIATKMRAAMQEAAKLNHGALFTDDDKATSSSISGADSLDEEDETTRMRRMMGEKMTKIGAAVKAVKIDKDALERLNRDSSFQHPDTTDFRNMMRDKLSSSHSNSLGGNPGPLKVKSLRSKSTVPVPKRDTLPEVELRRIPGRWLVTVEMERRTDDPEKLGKLLGREDGDPPFKEVCGANDASDQFQELLWTYKVVLEKVQIERRGERASKSFTKELTDILIFHSQISQCTSEVRGYDEDYLEEENSNAEGEISMPSIRAALCEQMVVAASMLDGVLDIAPSDMEHVDVRAFQCEVIQSYLDAVLASPLPESALSAVFHFFDMNPLEGLWKGKESSGLDITLPPVPKTFELGTSDIFAKRISSLESILAKATSKISIASNVCKKQSPTIVAAKEIRPIANATTAYHDDELHTALRDALLTAKRERDEADAQLLASSVMHVKELEQERRKATRMAKRLQAANESPKQTELRKHEQELVDNSEQELMAMCKQMTTEITAKTEASLEIARLKEKLKTDQEADSARIGVLRLEVECLRRQLEDERAKTAKATREALHWETSFRGVMKGDGDA